MFNLISEFTQSVLQLTVSSYFAPLTGCTIILGVLGLIYMLTGKSRGF